MARIHYEHVSGYHWCWWTDDETKYYCTNTDGEGLFYVDLHRNIRKQLSGTCQFSLRGISDPRGKIRRLMNSKFIR